MSILSVGSASMGFSKSLMPEKSLQVTRLRLVTWKDFSGICDLENPILALPPHRIGSIPTFSDSTKRRNCPIPTFSEHRGITKRPNYPIPSFFHKIIE